jgi:DNA-binding NarL/FixJ family response regulator
MMVLIVAQPGLFREALSGLLCTMPEIKVVGVTATLDAALESVRESCPGIMLWVIDELDAEHLVKVQGVKAICPRTPIVALVEDPKEAQALEDGAVDVALAKEVPPPKLAETISEFLRPADDTTPSPLVDKPRKTNIPN